MHPGQTIAGKGGGAGEAAARSEVRRLVFRRFLDGLAALGGERTESVFASAYETGRLAIARGLGIVDVVQIHREALAQVARRRADVLAFLDDAHRVLGEALAPFEMVHLAVRETAERLQVVNELLAARAADLRAANETIQRLLHQRSSFLSEASRALAHTLDLDEVLRAIARLPVPLLAEWCSVELAGDGETKRVAGPHEDPSLTPLVEELARVFSLPEDAGYLQPGVLRTGFSENMRHADEETVAALVEDPRSRELLAALDVRHWLVVRLAARGRVLGTLTLVRSARRPPFSDEEHALGDEFAGRAALAVDNARLYREAREAAELRDAFLSVASHELRTPLTPLVMRLQQLEQRLRRAGHADAELVVHALRNVGRLRRLVDELLDVSRIQAGRLELERQPVALDELVCDAVPGYRAVHPRHRFVVDLAPDVVVLGDRMRLEQVLTNLLENAVKYSPEGGDVYVRVLADGDEVELTVSDEGIGVPEGQGEHLFERFFRAENAQVRSFGGLGLGLFICRDIVERHGGRIWVESRVGRGSSFHVRLPRAPAAPRGRTPLHDGGHDA